jgi:hypothetical protein
MSDSSSISGEGSKPGTPALSVTSDVSNGSGYLLGGLDLKAAKEVEKIGVECKFAKLENMAAAEPGGNGDD